MTTPSPPERRAPWYQFKGHLRDPGHGKQPTTMGFRLEGISWNFRGICWCPKKLPKKNRWLFRRLVVPISCYVSYMYLDLVLGTHLDANQWYLSNFYRRCLDRTRYLRCELCVQPMFFLVVDVKCFTFLGIPLKKNNNTIPIDKWETTNLHYRPTIAWMIVVGFKTRLLLMKLPFDWSKIWIEDCDTEGTIQY